MLARPGAAIGVGGRPAARRVLYGESLSKSMSLAVAAG